MIRKCARSASVPLWSAVSVSVSVDRLGRNVRLVRARGDSGAAAVEFALVGVFVLLPLVAGSMDAGMALRAKIKMQSAAGNAAQYVIHNPCAPDATLTLIAQADAPGATVTVSRDFLCGGAASNPAGSVTIESSVYVSLIFGGLVPGLSNPQRVTGFETVETIGARS